jgi:hypothetical protein
MLSEDRVFWPSRGLKTVAYLSPKSSRMTRATQELPNHYRIALAMFLATAALHWPTKDAGFVADFWGWEKLYREQSFWGFWNTFGHTVHQQLPQFFNIVWYRLFGTQGLPWYLLFSLLHAANGYLLYRFLLKTSGMWQLSHGKWVALAGASFFLCSPYIADATVWRVCLHYLLSGGFTLGALLAVSDYLERGHTKVLWWAHGLLLLHYFTLEFALATPLVVHALCFGWWLTQPRETQKPVVVENFLRLITLPQLAITALFFASNKLTFGQWVGHYGESTHLKFNTLQMLAQPFKYLAKYWTFGRHWDHGDKARLFGFIDSERGLWILYGLLLGLVASALWIKRRQHPRLSLGLLCCVMGFLAVFPVSNLHFEWVLFNELDRYGYLASLFFLSTLAMLFSALPGWWKNLPAGAFLLVSLFYLHQTLGWWKDMDDCYKNLLRDFRWYDKKNVCILASADNYKGIWVVRSYRDKPALQYGLELMHHKPLDMQLTEVAQFNMNNNREGITATTDSTGMIRVEFNQWGNWWWKFGRGANNVDNEQYKAVFKGKWFEFTPKNMPPNTTYIYQSGNSWKAVGE